MNKLISVKEAESIILNQPWISEPVSISAENAAGSLLAETLSADRDLPPFDRVMMDGIAINSAAFKSGQRRFQIYFTLAAGMEPVALSDSSMCVEIMTGAVLPLGCDAVIRYEDLEIKDGFASILVDTLEPGQNIHSKGFDKKRGDVLVSHSQKFRAAESGIAASIGRNFVLVKNIPRVAIISTGDELVEVHQQPKDWQIRRSNAPALNTLLQTLRISAENFHLADNRESILNFFKTQQENFDCFLFSGGVSKGKFDYLPGCFEESGFQIHLHGVKQRPGKPFLFASKNNRFIFGFPGNPVSTLVCALRYFIPWLKTSMGALPSALYAKLNSDVEFKPGLSYFLEVQLECDQNAQLIATPIKGHGSGDLANLSRVSGFLELPEDRVIFKSGEVFSYWPIASYE
jgi:molybdopterin molybdotransferase